MQFGGLDLLRELALDLVYFKQVADALCLEVFRHKIVEVCPESLFINCCNPGSKSVFKVTLFKPVRVLNEVHL